MNGMILGPFDAEDEKAMFSIEGLKSLGLDGLQVVFYKEKLWDGCGEDITREVLQAHHTKGWYHCGSHPKGR
jgi:hypothetical protein